MSNEEIANKLHEYADYLHLSNIISDIFRWLGWIIVQGIAWLVDALENITDNILFTKSFFQNDAFLEFVDSTKPVLTTLLAFSILYTGYLIMFRKKVQREVIAVNLIVTLSILTALLALMEKANEITDIAIDTVKTESIYGNSDYALSDQIIDANLTDLTMFEESNWSTTTLEQNNSIPTNYIAGIDITEALNGSSDEYDLNTGKDISQHKLVWSTNKSSPTAVELDQGGLADWNNEYYYRYHIEWISLLVTLCVLGFTLLSISIKVARLAYELAFNYVLAILIAPADLHDGQKTKKVIQSILNTFLVTILIFVSIKIYMLGINFITEETTGVTYLICLIAFSIAVLDGPNIVERLFGIDAGLKGGWTLLAGTYATAKMTSGIANGFANALSKNNGNKKENNKGDTSAETKMNDPKRSPLSQQDVASPFSDEQQNSESPYAKRKVLSKENKGGLNAAENNEQPTREATPNEKAEETTSIDTLTANSTEQQRAVQSENTLLTKDTSGNAKNEKIETSRNPINNENESLETQAQQTVHTDSALSVKEQTLSQTNISRDNQSTLAGSVITSPGSKHSEQAAINNESTQSSQTPIQRYSQVEQQIAVSDTGKVNQTMIISSQFETSNDNVLPTNTAAPTVNDQMNISQGNESRTTAQTNVQQENIHQVDEQIKVEKVNRQTVRNTVRLVNINQEAASKQNVEKHIVESISHKSSNQNEALDSPEPKQ